MNYAPAFATAAFFGLGAYTTAIAMNHGAPFLVAMPLGGVVGATVAGGGDQPVQRLFAALRGLGQDAEAVQLPGQQVAVDCDVVDQQQAGADLESLDDVGRLGGGAGGVVGAEDAGVASQRQIVDKRRQVHPLDTAAVLDARVFQA